MFQLVEVRELKVNQKYKIKENNLEYIGLFKGTFRVHSNTPLCVCFDKLTNHNSDKTLLFYDTAKFYAFVSEPQ